MSIQTYPDEPMEPSSDTLAQASYVHPASQGRLERAALPGPAPTAQRWLPHQVIGLLASHDVTAALLAPLQFLVRSIRTVVEHDHTRGSGAPFALVDADDRRRTPQAVVVSPARDPRVCSL